MCVSRLADITVGGDFLGLCDQKSSYKHVSDFGRLGSYGHFLILVHGTAVRNQLAGHALNLESYRLHCKRYLPPDSPTQLQTVQFPYHDTWKLFKEGGLGEYWPGQCILPTS